MKYLLYDKIIKELHPEVLKAINELANSGNRDKLIQWLEECKAELEIRNTYELQCEKEYIQSLLR